ncbi:hypothetical protein C8J57DRAFT_1228463 [Mycena rebaudengoi]|nr:hypothetical protein C8J57DRAFT_1228463 [Mycena rebaudengoi]
MSQCAPLGGLVVRRRSGLVDTSEKRGQLGAAAHGPVCERVLNADGVFSELSELNPNLASRIVLGEEVDDMCRGIAQPVSCSDVENCSVGVLKWFLGEEFGGLWVMLPHLAIRNGAFAGAYTRMWEPHSASTTGSTPSDEWRVFVWRQWWWWQEERVDGQQHDDGARSDSYPMG